MSAPARSSRSASQLAVGIVLVMAVAAQASGPISGDAGSAAKVPAVDPRPPARIAAGVLAQLDRGQAATFWVVMAERADLSPAFVIDDWEDRGWWVYESLRSVADSSQAEAIGVVNRHGADHRSFWIVNAIRVTGDGELAEELARLPGVDRIEEPRSMSVPEPLPGVGEALVENVEWNVAAVGAPTVWADLGVRGEGIVVANIDTGVQYNHPALIAQYRGTQPDGSFSHDYSWFDPSGICGNPSLAPCDNHGHGTHTMGTMVGDDKATNQIGVAPGARWIAAKGCETNSCSDFALLASAQWILAPTDLSGSNPRPDLRPHVVNNSWGGGGGDDWYMGLVDAWIAAGVFPQFSNGNNGPGCGTSGSPGDYPQSYSAGAHSVDGSIGLFSSRGPSLFAGEVKPNLAAPGVNVRSSVPIDGYATVSGTSMASPHVAATVALMWSAAPTLVGDIDWTRDILDGTAVDVDDTSCGGDASDNNVWGEGMLDALSAVYDSPRGPTGFLEGTVGDGASGDPIEGALVHAEGESTRVTATDEWGFYRIELPVGAFEVSAGAFGYQDSDLLEVQILENETTSLHIELEALQSYTVQGVVLDTTGEPATGAAVQILGTPLEPQLTDDQGNYQFDWVPVGEYDLLVEAGRCALPASSDLVVNGNEQLDFVLSLRSDESGYGCRLAVPAFIRGDTAVALLGDDAQVSVELPFPFTFYGHTYDVGYVSTNGFVHFEPSLQSYFYNYVIPNIYLPQAAIYGFWDNLVVDLEGGAGFWSGAGTTSDGRQFFVLEWRNVSFFGDASRRIDFEIVLHDDGEILTQYGAIEPDDRERGSGAVIGLENEQGTVGFQYSCREVVLGSPEFAVRYLSLSFGSVTGEVRDTNDGLPVEGADVAAFDHNGNLIRSATTDEDGLYGLPLPVGSYSISASATHYVEAQLPAEIEQDGQTVALEFTLDTGRAEVDPEGLEFDLALGESDHRELTISNTGSAGVDWWLAERAGYQPFDVRWLEVSSNGGTLPQGESQIVTVTADATDMVPGTYQVTLMLTSTSGRETQLEIPVSLVVGNPGDAVAVNCGGGSYVDSDGAQWAADQAAGSGTWGYTDFRSRARSTGAAISDTSDDPLFQSYNRRPGSYVFPVADGSYLVELSFAEVEPEIVTGDRVVDIEAERDLLENDFDILGEIFAGVYRQTFTAYRFTYQVDVTDGELEISFSPIRRSQPAIINAIRIVQTSGP